jgi:hypothetical protein
MSSALRLDFDLYRHDPDGLLLSGQLEDPSDQFCLYLVDHVLTIDDIDTEIRLAPDILALTSRYPTDVTWANSHGRTPKNPSIRMPHAFLVELSPLESLRGGTF